MFEKLAAFAYSNRRRMLMIAAIGAVIAGVFGAGVSSRLSPYGADDAATQSVQATKRFQAATGRQIDPGVVALVSSGDIRGPAARRRVQSVAAELKAAPDVASVASFYSTGDPSMVARDGRSTYVVGYFKALSDKRLSDDAKLIESRFSGQHDVQVLPNGAPVQTVLTALFKPFKGVNVTVVLNFCPAKMFPPGC